MNNKALRGIIAIVTAMIISQQVFDAFLTASNQFVAGTIAVSMFIIVLIFVYDNFGQKDETPPDQPS